MRVGSGNVIKKRERSKKHKSKRCHCYTVIDIIKNLKSYIFVGFQAVIPLLPVQAFTLNFLVYCFTKVSVVCNHSLLIFVGFLTLWPIGK